jgi:hypothetical protein
LQIKETEGVIQFQLDFTPAPPLPAADLAELNAWRGLLYRLGLTGRDPDRYGGLAYGNVSLRLDAHRFVVSGTQTGGLAELGAEHYSVVTRIDLEYNRLWAEGPIPPSSEALTHGAVYQSSTARCVLHVHSPELWQFAADLSIPVTPADIGYGTPAMAEAVGRLAQGADSRVIAMGGHQDGLIAFAPTLDQAALPLIRLLAEALRIAAAKTRAVVKA